jgi:periplasmic protein TonB
MKATIVLFMLACCMGFGPGKLLGGNGCDTGPAVIHKVEAGYTEKARRANIQGKVVLRFEVDPSGRVVNVQVVSGLGGGLDENALKALRKSRFRPGYDKDGNAASCVATVEFLFRLL